MEREIGRLSELPKPGSGQLTPELVRNCMKRWRESFEREMVGAIKKRLGIKAVEDENLKIAKALLAHSRRIDEALEAAHVGQRMALDNQKDLTLATEKPIMEAKPKVVNWRNFRTAAERASIQEQEP